VDHVLGTSAKVRLLRELLPLEHAVSWREASRRAGLSPGTANRALGELTDSGVLDRKEAGRQHLYAVNRRSFLVQGGLEQLFKAEESRLSEIILWIQNRLAEAGSETGAEVLNASIYGSVAREGEHPGSDFDLFIVVKQPTKASEIRDHLVDQADDLADRFGLRLSAVSASPDQLEDLTVARDPFLQGMLEDGIRVYGRRLEELVKW
jgi:predicted nucleotidyltransferase